LLLTTSALSLHPPLHRLRFTLRLAQQVQSGSGGTASALLLGLQSHGELQKLILDLLVSECGAHAGGKGGEASISSEHVEYLHLRKIEERASASNKKLFNPFSSNESAAASLASIASSSGAPQNVWHAVVVIQFASEAAAEYIAAHMHQLDTSAQSVFRPSFFPLPPSTEGICGRARDAFSGNICDIGRSASLAIAVSRERISRVLLFSDHLGSRSCAVAF
jgi:hypothetical protein